MTNPNIANQNRRRAAPRPVFRLGLTTEGSTLFPGSSKSNQTAPVIGHIHDKGSNWTFVGLCLSRSCISQDQDFTLSLRRYRRRTEGLKKLAAASVPKEVILARVK